MSEWRKLRLGTVCQKIGSGSTPRGGSGVYLDSGEVALIRSQNIYNDGFHRNGLVYLTEQHASELANVQLEINDVLLNITGDSVARSCQVALDVLPARVNQHVAIIRPDPKILSPLFLRYYLISPLLQAQMLGLAAVGATRNALTKGMIESIEVCAPVDVEEQRAIAHILGALDDKIELNRRMNETLEAMARTIFQSWFVNFDPVHAKANGESPESICQRLNLTPELLALFPDSFEDSELGEIPKGWRVGALEEALVFQRGFDLPAADRTPGKFQILAASGPSGTHHECMVPGPGVTTGRSGVLGKVFYVHEDYWPLNTSLWVKEFRQSTPAYAFHLLQGLDFSGLNAGSAVPTLNRNHAHAMRVILPSMDLIERFELVAVMLLKQQLANSQKIDVLSEVRDSLLPKLLSGDLALSGLNSLARAEA